MPQLKAYHRPPNVDEVLKLLARPDTNTAVIGGGSYLTAHLPEMVDEVVDLQAVAGLDEVTYTGHGLKLGAMVRLQTIVDDERAPALLREVAHREGPNTLRHTATMGGVIAGHDKESELLAALLVFDAEIQVQTTAGVKHLPLTNFLRDVPAALGNGVITSATLNTLGQTAGDRVARTPADKPIVAALARRGHDERIRLALCGVANTPVLVDPDNVKAAINPPDDFRGSREYRRQMAAALAKRVVSAVSSA
jgi:CO/xanthine dehydrogenase FAD-binding subunit